MDKKESAKIEFIQRMRDMLSKKESVNNRLVYIQYIIRSFNGSQNTLLPTPAEERSLEEALRRVVDVASSKACDSTEGTFSCNSSSSGKASDRKQCLKKMFDQLCWMERKRLYDPPGDDIIGHYLRIKKYIRAILAFNLGAKFETIDVPLWDFPCSSTFHTSHHAEELLELNQQLEDLSKFLLEKDVDDGFTLAPLMARKESNERMVPPVSRSNEKSYMFYCHKFLLANVDLKYSGFGNCPPLENEKISYVHVLENIAVPLLETSDDEKNVFSDKLFDLYLEAIYHELVDIERHLSKIRGWIMKNLSFTEEWWESKAKQFSLFDLDDEDSDHFVEFKKGLADDCEVSDEDLPDHISQIDRLCTIARLLVVLVSGENVYKSTSLGVLRTLSKLKPTRSWEIVHALSVFKQGPFIESVFQEQPILQKPQELVPLENYPQVEKGQEHILDGKGHNENAVILEEIINDLIDIGDSSIMLDQQEMKLAWKIWGSVASSAHFFVSAKTYEQRRHMMKVLELPVKDDKESISLQTVQVQQPQAVFEMQKFASILCTYKVVLSEKLKESSKTLHHLRSVL